MPEHILEFTDDFEPVSNTPDRRLAFSCTDGSEQQGDHGRSHSGPHLSYSTGMTSLKRWLELLPTVPVNPPLRTK